MLYSIDDTLQSAFADLTGDWNPMHVDPVEARRTMFGRQVVHGIHTCLRALDVVAETHGLPPFRKLAARFIKPVFIGESVRVVVNSRPLDCVIECFVGSSRVAHISLSDPDDRGPQAFPSGEPPSWRRAPRLLTPDHAEGDEGSLSIVDRESALQDFFPCAFRDLGGRAVAVLLRLTRIVGMECPGHNSLFSSFAIALGSDSSETGLQYRVAQVNRKIGLVRLDVAGAAEGRIDAFFRPAIPADPTTLPAHARPRAGEFEGRRALVVGGSRGLGRVTSLLLAAGGADVTVTYRVGRSEALELVDAIRHLGVAGDAVEYDVSVEDDRLAELSARYRPTDLYYFVTPPIFVRKVQNFEVSLYRKFVEFYAMGFLRTVTSLQADRLSVFYPSSVAIDEPLQDLAEYAAAKAAGEQLCEFLSMADDRLTILHRRLPRLPTDQTATLMDVEAADPYLTMLDVCREMCRRSGSSPNPT